MWASIFNRIPRGVWYILSGCVVLVTLAVCVVLLAGGSMRWGSFEVAAPEAAPPADVAVPTDPPLPPPVPQDDTQQQVDVPPPRPRATKSRQQEQFDQQDQQQQQQGTP